MNILKPYFGRVPACGIFCGGCPVYTRDKKPCPGAEINQARCDNCKTFHLCCREKGVQYCFQCADYPCQKLKGFAKRWLKYGQNQLDNQQLLKDKGVDEFLTFFNSQAGKNKNV